MYRNAARGGPSHGHRQHAKIGEVWPRGFRVVRADRRTAKHTYILIEILCTHPGGEVTRTITRKLCCRKDDRAMRRQK